MTQLFTELMALIRSIPHVFKVLSFFERRREKKRQEQEKNKDALRKLLANKRRKATIAEVREHMQKAFGPAACKHISSADIHFAQAQHDSFHWLERRVAADNSVHCSRDGRSYSDRTAACGIFGGPGTTLGLFATVFSLFLIWFFLKTMFADWDANFLIGLAGAAVLWQIFNKDFSKFDAGRSFLHLCQTDCVVPAPYRPGDQK